MELILVLILAALLIALFWFVLKANEYKRASEEVTARFQGIVDRDAEIARREQEIHRLSSEYESLDEKHKKKLAELSEDYSKYKTTYDQLRHEQAILEETTEIQSYGLYKPHLDFASSEEYKQKLQENYDKQKELVKNDRAIVCPVSWTVGGSAREGERMTKQNMKVMLRAFNGECDAAMLKVRWNNVNIMEERIRKSFDAINKSGTVNRISITDEYLNAKLEELYLTHEMEEKRYKEKEEQRQIQEQMREEEKTQRELEKARQEAEDEERRYQKALEKAREEMEKAKGKDIEEFQEKMSLLEDQLKEAQEEKERALSRAQMTKSGHVYVISNIGSFGENVFKIGMTRRLEPLDRVRELGDASVPFPFDVHALVYSDNAPELEYELQSHFETKRVNLVNDRKEFYYVTVEDLDTFAKEHNVTIQFTKMAEAKEYRETLALRESQTEHAEATMSKTDLPENLIPNNQ